MPPTIGLTVIQYLIFHACWVISHCRSCRFPICSASRHKPISAVMYNRISVSIRRSTEHKSIQSDVTDDSWLHCWYLIIQRNNVIAVSRVHRTRNWLLFPMQHTSKSTTCRSMWVRQLGGEWSFSTRSCNFSLTFSNTTYWLMLRQMKNMTINSSAW